MMQKIFISPQGFSRQDLCFASVTFFLFHLHLLLNDRLEERDLRIYQTDLKFSGLVDMWL